MNYNLSAINASNPVTLIRDVNNVFMFGWFDALLLLIIFFLIFQAFVNNGWMSKIALMHSLLFVAICATWFWAMDWTTDIEVFLCWILYGLAVLTNIFMRDG